MVGSWKWFGALCAIAAFGCSANEPVSDSLGVNTDEAYENVASVEEAIRPDKCWFPGMAPIALEPEAGAACYLTLVAGDFDDLATKVRVFRRAGFWWLDGAAAEGTGLRACAACIGAIAGPEGGVISVSGSAVANSAHLAPASIPIPGGPQVCMLTYMGGKFTTGSSIFVEPTPRGWGVFARSSAPGSQVEGRAVCINKSSPFEHAWSSPSPSTNLGSAANRTCFFTRIGGRFQSHLHYVNIVTTLLTSTNWWLGGSTDAGPRLATARCVM
jgi:hypothetical protein